MNTVAGRERSECRHFERMRDQHNLEPARGAGGHGEADTVKRDRTFFHDERVALALMLDPEHVVSVTIPRKRDAADFVDMALHEVAPEAVGGAKRKL